MTRLGNSVVAAIVLLIFAGVIALNAHAVSQINDAATPTPTPTPTPPPSGDCTDEQDGSRDYGLFFDNASAGFMQLVTIPWYPGFDVLDDYGYLDASDAYEGKDKVGYHTFAVSGVGLDARTGMGCFEAWSFDGLPDSYGYKEAFCISAPDMYQLFENGAYFLSYRSY